MDFQNNTNVQNDTNVQSKSNDVLKEKSLLIADFNYQMYLKEQELCKLCNENVTLRRYYCDLNKRIERAQKLIAEKDISIHSLTLENSHISNLKAQMKHKETQLAKSRNENVTLRQKNSDLIKRIEADEMLMIEKNSLIDTLSNENSDMTTLQPLMNLQETELNKFFNENIELKQKNRDLVEKIESMEIVSNEHMSLIHELMEENSSLNSLKTQIKLKETELVKSIEENVQLKQQIHDLLENVENTEKNDHIDYLKNFITTLIHQLIKKKEKSAVSFNEDVEFKQEFDDLYKKIKSTSKNNKIDSFLNFLHLSSTVIFDSVKPNFGVKNGDTSTSETCSTETREIPSAGVSTSFGPSPDDFSAVMNNVTVSTAETDLTGNESTLQASNSSDVMTMMNNVTVTTSETELSENESVLDLTVQTSRN